MTAWGPLAHATVWPDRQAADEWATRLAAARPGQVTVNAAAPGGKLKGWVVVLRIPGYQQGRAFGLTVDQA